MALIPIILFVFSASIDSFVVAFAYGSRNIKIGIASNFLIAAVTAIGTFLSMLVGKLFIDKIPLNIANLIGAFILFLLGIYFIVDYKKSKYIKKPEEFCEGKQCHKAILKFPEVADTNNSGNIEVSESIALATALTLNNISLGIAASITGLDIYLTTLVTFVISILFIWLGFFLSKHTLNKFIADKGSLISGIIILILALIEALV
ncbi:MAG: sporulation membrane protein YtaF [Sarcina sp.]